MLKDRPVASPAPSAWPLTTGARVLGLEVAEADFRRGQWGGWWKSYWDEEGRLKAVG